MNEISIIHSFKLPTLITAVGDRAAMRFIEFFTANIRNPHTRRAYNRAVYEFMEWCTHYNIYSVTEVQPIHVAAWIEERTQTRSAPTVKQGLAALKHLFDWLVIGQVIPTNPAASVRGPKHVVTTGKTPALSQDETRELLGSIDISTLIGLRDRALIALMAYTFARVSASTAMKVADVYTENRRLWVKLHEKGGKEHKVPCHHNLEIYLTEYLETSGLIHEPKSPLFPKMKKGTNELSRTPLTQQDAYDMIDRRRKALGIKTKIGNHSFRATGITAYLDAKGPLETARAIANHASTRTTQLYDRRSDNMTLDEVERIRF